MVVVSLPIDIDVPITQNNNVLQEYDVVPLQVNEPEYSDIVEPNDVSEEVLLRPTQRVWKQSLTNDYVVYFQENDFGIHDDDDDDDPTTFEEATSSFRDYDWLNAMHGELASLAHNVLWDISELLVGCKTVGCKWVF